MTDPKKSGYPGGIGITTILLTLAIIAIIILLGGFLFNYTRIDQLTRSLEDTKKQIQNVQMTSQDAKENVQESAMEGAQDIASAIKDVENPAARLALAKAYAARLNSFLTASERSDLNTVVLYIEKNPSALYADNPNLPADVQDSLDNLRAKLSTVRSNSVATIQEVDEATYSLNEELTITGTIRFVDDDEVLGGSIFALEDKETGNIFYLHFNEANSENIKQNMLDQEVSIEIRVTSRAGQPLTFQVVSGPVLAEETSDETEPTTPAATATP